MVTTSASASSQDSGLLNSLPGSSVSTESIREQPQACTQSTATRIPVPLSHVSRLPEALQSTHAWRPLRALGGVRTIGSGT